MPPLFPPPISGERTSFKTSGAVSTWDERVATRTKIAVVVRDDLAGWQRLNVTAFLASGITAAHPELMGEDYVDAYGREYLPLLGLPVLVYAAPAPGLAHSHARAVSRDLPTAIYSHGMFTTGNDTDNRGVVAERTTDDLDLVGFAVRGPRNAVDKICKGLALHP